MTIGKNLPPPFPRRIVPNKADLGDWSQLEPLFDLLDRAAPATASAMEEWLLDWNDLAAALAEEGSRRYVAMTCHTDDPACEKRFLHFIEEIEPRAKPRWQKLRTQYAALPAGRDLPRPRYFVLDRSIRNEVELFRPENVPLEKEEEKLCVEYQKLTGAMTVTFDGKERTLQQMAKYYDLIDRPVRHSAWELVASRRLQDRQQLDDIFDRLLKLRQTQAQNAGCDDYRAYAFRRNERFDYGVKECEQFHAAVEKVVVPLHRRIQARRKKTLDLEPLRPWDLSVDPQGRPPLRPFQKAGQLVKGCTEILSRVHPEFGSLLAFLRQHSLLDLESRKGKAPGGYQAVLSEHRLPFIFMNAVGLQGDVSTLLHEAGHSVHSMECRQEPLLRYRQAGPEFAEVASMSMERLGSDFLEVFYNAEEAERARVKEVEEDIWLLCWIATVDAFQHWIYTHAGHRVEERQAAWLELHRRFGGIEDYSGYEDALKNGWHRQLHIFLSPFYYIEYGIALLGALQVWQAVQKDKAAGLAAFRRGLALGGTRPLPELFAAAGLRFDFSEQTVRPAVEKVAGKLNL